MTPKNFISGLVIVLIGVIFLGINFGWWSGDVWSNIWRLWPVLLILAGLKRVVRSEPLFFLLAILVIAGGYILISDARFPARFNMMRSSSVQTTPTPGVTPEVSPETTPPTIREQLGEVLGLNKTEENAMNEFKSEIQVGSLDALAIQLSRNYDLTMTGNDGTSVKVELNGPQKMLDDVSLAPDGNRLVLKNSPEADFGIFTDKEKVTGTISLPKSLHTAFQLSGVVKIKVQNMNGSAEFKNSGVSSIEYANSTTVNPTANLSGTAKVMLDQCQGTSDVDLSGVGTMTANSCQLTNLIAKGSGTGTLEIKGGTVGDFKGNTSGVAKLKLPKPSGKIEVDSDGASSITYN